MGTKQSHKLRRTFDKFEARGRVSIFGGGTIIMGDRVQINGRTGIYKGRHRATGQLVVWTDDAIVHCSPNEVSKVF